MAIRKITKCALLASTWVLASCAVPRATIVEAAPVAKKTQKAPEPVVAEEPPVPELPDDGLRVSGMLDLPSEADFRTASPVSPRTETGSGGVIARPPTDPPSRLKPPAPEAN